MTEPNGPPFTVPRYGSLGESIIAERDWLKQQNEQLRGNLSLAEEGLANYAQEVERLKEGLARIKELSDGKSIAWTLAYEALNDRPYGHAGCSGEPQSGE